ncbi:twin-arginine translocase TatA/TatE family subunit [Candidatus Woesearchaeota archaeon]|nr:twin-arginine translocase TatA/TatE family subunit [Candidatus Woesearchaeota archaeon]
MIGMTEILVILAIVLILFGPKKLPELARSIGKAVREYKKGLSSDKKPRG